MRKAKALVGVLVLCAVVMTVVYHKAYERGRIYGNMEGVKLRFLAHEREDRL